MDILILITISQLKKNKKLTKKRTPKFKKIQNIYKEASKIDFITKFDYGYFILFSSFGSQDSTQKFQVILIKNEGMAAILPNFSFIFNWENQRHAFIFARNDLRFFV